MADMVVNSEYSLSQAIGMLRASFKERKFFTMRLKFGRIRSVDQNRLAHAWYNQVANELREDDARGVKRFCKLHFGVPILRAEDDEFRDAYNRTMLKTLTYEQKIIAMDMLPVTSQMTTKQISKYLEDVQAHYRKHGVMLEFPEEGK